MQTLCIEQLKIVLHCFASTYLYTHFTFIKPKHANYLLLCIYYIKHVYKHYILFTHTYIHTHTICNVSPYAMHYAMYSCVFYLPACLRIDSLSLIVSDMYILFIFQNFETFRVSCLYLSFSLHPHLPQC